MNTPKPIPPMPRPKLSFAPTSMSASEARRNAADARNAGRIKVAEELAERTNVRDLMREPGHGVGIRRR